MAKSQFNQSRGQKGVADTPEKPAQANGTGEASAKTRIVPDIEVLTEEFIKQYRAGIALPVSDYVSKYPELRDEIEECFPAIVALEGMKGFDKHDGKISLGRSQPKQLGDFRIVREIGRGGMGIVYEAIQESLNRPVAIKVLPRHFLLEPKQLTRFQKEAQIAASLHHTNIVPVFGVGEDDGFHFYVMQLNNGVGLDELLQRMTDTEPQSDIRLKNTKTQKTTWIYDSNKKETVSDSSSSGSAEQNKEFPWDKFLEQLSTPEGVTRVGIQAADAIQYAHERNILHRDIKPGNILIDQDGLVRVTDFGLARAATNDSRSMSEEVVGTLGYMAPEMLKGEAIPQSDIYSLGITLYELLTQQVAFERSARSHIIDRIRSGSIKPPRSINNKIPRDLETIILKAIAVDPRHRYQTARELKEDLIRFRQDRPIHARRVSVLEKLYRWSRRNPMNASLSGLAFLLLFIIGVVSSTGYQAELIQRKRAEETATLATESLDRLFNRFVPNRLSSSVQMLSDDSAVQDIQNQPILSKESALILTEMIGFYEDLAQKTGEKIEYQQKTAEAYRKVGDIHHRLGDYDSGLKSYGKALRSYQNLISFSNDVDNFWLIDKAAIQNEMGLIYRKNGDKEKGMQYHQNALDTLKTIPEDIENSSVLYEKARTYFLMARHLRPELRRGINEELFGDNDFEVPNHHRSGPPPNGKGFGKHRGNKQGPGNGRPPHMQGGKTRKVKMRDPEKDKYLEQAEEILEKLVREHPQNAEFQYLLALTLQEKVPDTLNKPEDLKKTEERVIQLLEDLVSRYPHIPDYRLALVNCFERIDVRNEPPENMTEELVNQLRKAIPHAEQLVTDFPTIPLYKITLIHVHNKLASVLEYMMWELPEDMAWNYLNSAEQSRRTSLRLQKELAALFPESALHQHWLAKFHISLASVISERDNFEEAIPHLETAVSQLVKQLESNPQEHRNEHELSKAYELIADLYKEKGEHDKSKEYREMAKEYHPSQGYGRGHGRGPEHGPGHQGPRQHVPRPEPGPEKP